jgi:palmitoyltransferase ZDHHC13/17
MTYANVAIDGLCLLLHIILACRNPGFIKNDGLEFMKLLETFDAHSLCPDCEIIRTGRSRHCIVCNLCVDRYDHHCPWINNCVGYNNHNMFLVYLVVQQCSLIFTVVCCIFAYFNFEKGEIKITPDFMTQGYYFYPLVSLLAIICTIFIIPMF